MSEDIFFNALFQIMWDMETDIFSEELKTLALLADIVPKCKKQRKRLEAMYRCGAMSLIEQAVAMPDLYELYMKRAVRVMIEELNISPEKALFSINQIAELWDGDLKLIEEYSSDEPLDEETEAQLKSAHEEKVVTNSQSNDQNTEPENKPSDSTPPENEQKSSADDSENRSNENNENDKEKDGEENMIFLQDMAEEQSGEVKEEAPVEEQNDGGGGGDDRQPRESVLKKIVLFWCKSDYEDGRPFMIACPIGWILIMICCILGIYMVYDIPTGDKFAVPSFALMFTMLTSKRLYRFESSFRFSLIVSGFYLAAMVRVLWIGKGYPPVTCVPMILAALIVFNSGRVGSFLDESKKGSFFAYTMIIVFAAAITVGAYAIQQVEF